MLRRDAPLCAGFEMIYSGHGRRVLLVFQYIHLKGLRAVDGKVFSSFEAEFYKDALLFFGFRNTTLLWTLKRIRLMAELI